MKSVANITYQKPHSSLGDLSVCLLVALLFRAWLVPPRPLLCADIIVYKLFSFIFSHPLFPFQIMIIMAMSYSRTFRFNLVFNVCLCNISNFYKTLSFVICIIKKYTNIGIRASEDPLDFVSLFIFLYQISLSVISLSIGIWLSYRFIFKV